MTQGWPLIQELLLSHWQNDLGSTVRDKTGCLSLPVCSLVESSGKPDELPPK